MLSTTMVNSNQHCQVMMRPDGRCYVIPNSTNLTNGGEFEEQPVSRTYQYRKVMKPMLERKRRARINRCLDELKELMLTALQSEGENASKLEKADILEMTVRYLHKLKSKKNGYNIENAYTDRFLAGFMHCTHEVSQYLQTVVHSQQHVDQTSLQIAEPTIEQSSGMKLLRHLAFCIRRMEHSNHRPDEAYLTPPPSPSPNSSFSTGGGSIRSLSPTSSSVWRPW